MKAQTQQQLKQVIETSGDAVAVGVAGASLLQLIPAVAALFTIVWTGIRLYELITGRKFTTTRIARLLSKLLKYI